MYLKITLLSLAATAGGGKNCAGFISRCLFLIVDHQSHYYQPLIFLVVLASNFSLFDVYDLPKIHIFNQNDP